MDRRERRVATFGSWRWILGRWMVVSITLAAALLGLVGGSESPSGALVTKYVAVSLYNNTDHTVGVAAWGRGWSLIVDSAIRPGQQMWIRPYFQDLYLNFPRQQGGIDCGTHSWPGESEPGYVLDVYNPLIGEPGVNTWNKKHVALSVGEHGSINLRGNEYTVIRHPDDSYQNPDSKVIQVVLQHCTDIP